MRKHTRIIQTIFGIPWLIFGVQHFIYADFVAGLVPAYFPARNFWALFTGAAMIAAGIGFIVNIKARLAAVSLGVMLLIFILLIHIPKITALPDSTAWTRFLQDIAIASTAFMLADIISKQGGGILKSIAKFSRYLFAVLLIAFGIEQFLNLDFLTARVPDYLPLRLFWVYLTGVAMIITGASVLINKKAKPTATLLGALMLTLNTLFYSYALANDLHNPLNWTAAMLNLTITCGVFVLAISSPEEE